MDVASAPHTSRGQDGLLLLLRRSALPGLSAERGVWMILDAAGSPLFGAVEVSCAV